MPNICQVLNCIADRESRSMRDRSDWKLDQQSFMKINGRYGSGPICIEADQSVPTLLQSAARSICRGIFLQNWSTVRGFANPPWNLISRVLNKVQVQRADLILVTLCERPNHGMPSYYPCW